MKRAMMKTTIARAMNCNDEVIINNTMATNLSAAAESKEHWSYENDREHTRTIFAGRRNVKDHR